MVKYIPERGDIVWLNFEPQKGREIQKVRPALVISPLKYNQVAKLALFMPITSQIKNYPFEIVIDHDQIQGAILTDQIRSLDWRSRNAQKITDVDSKILHQAISRIRLLLD